MALVKWLFVGLVAVLVSSSILYFIQPTTQETRGQVVLIPKPTKNFTLKIDVNSNGTIIPFQTWRAEYGGLIE